jgi:hypothetical protein
MLLLRAVLAGFLLFATTAAAQPSAASSATQADTTVAGLKSPTIARLLAIVPGAGHMYAGEMEHGLIVATVIPSLVLAGALAGCLSVLFTPDQGHCERSTPVKVSLIAAGGLWAWSIFDAGRAARRTNAKRAASASFFIQPTRIPAAPGDDRIAVRLGVSIRR